MSSMNNTPETNTEPKHEHGTTRSYVRGFLLSLVFTFIPYYLVTEHALSGNALVATILGFAVVQMIIQIVFFLHLGREPKPNWNLLFFISTVGIILVVVVGSLWIMHHLHYNMTPVTPEDASKKLVEGEGIYQIGGEKTGACHSLRDNHQVVIKDGQATPVYIEADVCDTLTFVNEDEGTREMTFGVYPDHGVYAGETELPVRNGKNKTITLSEPGVYQFHDHADGSAAGGFTVTPR